MELRHLTDVTVSQPAHDVTTDFITGATAIEEETDHDHNLILYVNGGEHRKALVVGQRYKIKGMEGVDPLVYFLYCYDGGIQAMFGLVPLSLADEPEPAAPTSVVDAPAGH